MTKYFQIGNFTFRLDFDDRVRIPQNLTLFELQSVSAPDRSWPDYTYDIQVVDDLPASSGQMIAERDSIRVYDTPAGEDRLLKVPGASRWYAFYHETDSRRAEIRYAAADLEMIDTDTVFTSLLALERRLISRQSLILHCAYLYDQGAAILFSAPSETGKSTQAQLWETYKGSRQVNGDRALLRKTEEGWIAEGFPVCGSSEINHNESYPIRAVVMLSQGKTNTVRRLSMGEAFQQVYSQITVNRWQPKDVELALDLLTDLLASVPFYHLSCTISREAVDTLYRQIY